MLRLDQNPPARSPDYASVAEIPGEWFVAHTKSRFEKALAHDLGSLGIPYYLPMVERVTISGGKKRRLMAPLFTSYVFICGDSEARYAAMQTDRICQTLPVRRQAEFIAELTAVERALAEGIDLNLHPFAEVGRRCRVKSGPLQGTEGVVIQRDGAMRLVLQVSMLGQGASLRIEGDLLELVD
jgi:transcriptional antiterminator RfaH